MKFKITILTVFLLFAVLTLGAASANDNITDNIITDDASHEIQLEENADEVLEATDDGTFTALKTKIDGAGATLKLENNYTYDDGFDTDGIEISNSITIDGAGHSIDAKSKSKVFSLAADSISLKNIIFKNAPSDGIIESGWDSSNILIDNCTFINCNCEIYYMYSNGNTISNCSFIGCDVRSDPIITVWGENNAINNCEFINCDCRADFFIELRDSNNRIANCEFINYTGRDCSVIDVREGDNTIENCSFINCCDYDGGVAIDIGSSGNRVNNCSFINCSTTYGAGAIEISNSNVRIGNCTFIDCTRCSGVIEAEGHDITIDNCTFVSCSHIGIVGYDVAISNCIFIQSSEEIGQAISFSFDEGIGRRGMISNCSFINFTGGIDDVSLISILSENCDDVYDDCFVFLTNCNFTNCRFEQYLLWINNNAQYADDEGASFIAAVGNCTFNNCSSEESLVRIFGCDNSIEGCGFNNCRAPDGGAVFIDGGPNIINNCCFNNCSSNFGGAIKIISDEYYTPKFQNNMTITNCKFIECQAGSDGGAIDIDYEIFAAERQWHNPWRIIIRGCEFDSCSADYGGAVYISGCENYIENSTFTNCSASSRGGAFFMLGPNIIDNCSFTYCHADETGAIVAQCENDEVGYEGYNLNIISNSRFTGCWADTQAGAIEIYQGEFDEYTLPTWTTRIINCTFENCSNREGGAIRIRACDNVIENSNFNNCSAENGGAINFQGFANTVKKSNFTYCRASNNGGAICSINNNVDILNSRFEHNAAKIGSAVYGGNVIECTFEDNTQPDVHVIKAYSGFTVTMDDFTTDKGGSIFITLSNDATGFVSVTLYDDRGQMINSTRLTVVKGKKTQFAYSNLSLGIYDANITYSGDSKYYGNETADKVIVRPAMNFTRDVVIGDDAQISMDLANITGTMKVFVDGDEYVSQRITGGKFFYKFSTEGLSLGNHMIVFKYSGPSIDENIFNAWDGKTASFVPKEYVLNVMPQPTTADTDSNNDNMYVIYIRDVDGNLLVNATGRVEVNVFDSLMNSVQHLVIDVVGGIAKLDISQFKNGNYLIKWKYSGDNKYAPFSSEEHLRIAHKVSRIAADNKNILYDSGEKYSVTVYGINGKPLAGSDVTFSINGKSIGRSVTDANGVAGIAISKEPGSYKITATASGVSIVKKLTVKHILSLANVNVKKSAKKLIIKATLKKVNGKYLKAKKITLKFNGKKFTAKTNKKGVAKFTVTAKVLKKLKVGKKVTYQATYKKDTVKKFVKVKK